MILVNLPIKSDAPVVAPMHLCCNCGSTNNIKTVDTDLRRMPLFGFAGVEIKIGLPFPYCSNCIKSAKRRRPSVLGVLALGVLLAIAMGTALLFLGPQLSEHTIFNFAVPAICVASLLIVLAFYSIRKKSGLQSSYYQPVKLLNTGHKWPADITGLELGFTNKNYAEIFSSVNSEPINSKIIKVKVL